MKRILSTKLTVPRPSVAQLSRPHLLQQLQSGLERTLTCVVAPAGFGKTTLVSNWVTRVAEQGEAIVAWLTLDPYDDDPSRFWSALIAALRTVDPELGGDTFPLPDAMPASPEQLLTPLVNQFIEAFREPLVIVLDDYHVIHTPTIHGALAFLLENLPPHVHVVLISRSDPPLPLARMRARGQMGDLRAAQLRFTRQEVTAFLNDVMKLSLSGDTIRLLDARTEGWIAGIHLAALSMQSATDHALFVRGLSGSHHFIMDFLVEEVLQRQPPSLRAFLLKSSILSQLSASLCSHVTGEGNAAALLEELRRAQLFVIPLDDEQSWYRYHHLFAEMLCARLHREQPEEFERLHRRASDWYLRNAEGETAAYGEAIRHALAAGEGARAVQIIDQQAERLWARQEIATLIHWLESLPDSTFIEYPGQAIRLAQILVVNGSLARVSSLLHLADQGLEQADLSVEEQELIRAKIMAVRSNVVRYEGQHEEGITLARAALEELPESSRHSRTVAALSLATATHMQGDLSVAEPRYYAAIALCQEVNDLFLEISLRFLCGRLLEEQARLDEAESYFRDMLQRASPRGQRLTIAGWALIGLGNLAYDRNRLPLAESLLREGLELVQRGDVRFALFNALRSLTRLRLAQGDMPGAREMAAQFFREAQASQLPTIMRWASSVQAFVNLREGNLEEAAQWAFTARSRPDALFFTDRPAFTLSLRLLLAQGQPRALLERAAEQEPLLHRYGHRAALLDLHLLKAAGFRALRQADEARAELDAALALAAPVNFLRPFLDGGSDIPALLAALPPDHPQHEFADRLLQIAGGAPQPAPLANGRSTGRARPHPAPAFASEPLAEPLTEREVEVLELIAVGLSNKEIAEELVISLPTVKKHSSNIYGKLNVSNRTQAVARASELGLLPR